MAYCRPGQWIFRRLPVSPVPFPTVNSQEQYLGTGTSPYSHWLHLGTHALIIPRIYHSLAVKYLCQHKWFQINLTHLMRASKLSKSFRTCSVQGLRYIGVPLGRYPKKNPPAFASSVAAGQRARFTTPRMVYTQKLICSKRCGESIS